MPGIAAAPAVTLRTVGNALRQMQAATLTQLAADLAAPPREVEAMLAFWEHRGNVRRCETPAALGCGTTCRGCPVGAAGTSAVRVRPLRRGSRRLVKRRSPGRRGRSLHVRTGTAVVFEWISS